MEAATASRAVVHYGWHGVLQSFLATSAATWLEVQTERHLASLLMPVDDEQMTAWKNCFPIMREAVAELVRRRPEAGRWSIVFEYELPRERGRRPDVVILAGSVILVLEFKDFAAPLQAHIDQVEAYARDIRNYHGASHNHPVHALLALTASKADTTENGDVRIVAPPNLAAELLACADAGHAGRGLSLDLDAWLAADYAPLPSLVQAARAIFRHEPLPQIRRAQSSGISDTIAKLVAIGQQAMLRNELHLALVTGVPGAGKTLAGLQFVYENHFGDTGSRRSAVFLSGNGPLVKVLQYALKSTVFVQDVHGFLRQYGGEETRVPSEHIWVYDEAQRAWDSERVLEKRGHRRSEPQDFLNIGVRMSSWALAVGLIGEGQEIHLGEEAGLGQWHDAIASSGRRWTVHCSGKIAHLFPSATVEPSEALNLTASLRSHLAEDVQVWISQVLDGEIELAHATSGRVASQGFETYVTQSVDVAMAYVRDRYKEALDKRFGLLASSKAKNLEKYGVRNGFNYTKTLKEGPWYNDPPDSPRSCCALHDVATEFACQGLELDFPIVCWGDDLTWNGSNWSSPPQPRSAAHNPHRLRLNSYRVLLSRGRDGFLVFVPPESSMASTVGALRDAGLRPLV
jgi:hypothetical protein